MLTVSYFNYAIPICAFICFRNVFAKHLNPGDTCSLASGDQGLCKFLTDCSPALALISRGSFPTDLCSSQDTQFIVCCEDTNPVTKAPVTSKPDIQEEVPSPKVVTTLTVSRRKTGEISRQKCKEYSKYVWEQRKSPTLTVDKQVSNIFECPFEKLPLIVGGTFASRKEFPHMVLVGFNKGQDVEWSCGGSLISEYYVLTAGHCLRHSRMGLAKLIRVGMANQSDTTHMQQRTVSEVMYHPDYHAPQKYHDVALLKLATKVNLNSYARPACLHVEREIPYKKAIATGWGDIEFSAHPSNDLLKVVLEFFDNAACNKTYRRKILRGDTEIEKGILDEWMVCAGSHDDYKDTCRGDSGGPLQIYYQGGEDVKCMYSIVGVTSFGNACGLSKSSPGVYTRVSSYIKWIEDVVWPEQADTIVFPNE